MLRSIVKAMVPEPARRWIRRQQHSSCPRVGRVRFGDLRRVQPISRIFGFDRGRPIDRHYIDGFLARHAQDICGRVLEIQDAQYTKRFGGDRVTQSEVLHVEEGNPEATIVADLTSADQIPSDRFDCVILTQTLQCIYDIQAAVRTVHRILKPGGVVLATCTGIGQFGGPDAEKWGEYWRFTTQSGRRLFGDVFGADRVQVQAHGNVFAAVAALHGLSLAEVHPAELDYYDPYYQMLVTIRAQKGGA